jgi:hypothetical protein
MNQCPNCQVELVTATRLCLDCTDKICDNLLGMEESVSGSGNFDVPVFCKNTKHEKMETCDECRVRIRRIQDSQAEIFRLENLPKSYHLTGIEVVGIRTESYNWAKSVFEGENAIEKITKHINSIARTIEELRSKESGIRQLRAELEFKETENLSIEERQRWERDAKKMQSRLSTREKLAKEAKGEQSEKDKEIKKLIKVVGAMDTALWIYEAERGSNKRDKMIAGMMRLGIKKEQAEVMVPA